MTVTSINDDPEKPRWGPWSFGIGTYERKIQLRTLATVIYMMRLAGGPDPMPLVLTLREAEDFDPYAPAKHNAALERVRHMFDLLPAIHQRKIIATFNSVTYPQGYDINKW